jgi:aerobic-type carbon monoxide dehydrogenase small subunit (CoxS/CutS family)
MKISFEVNDQMVEVDVTPMARLLDVLREDLRLTGSKEGCGEGECGACSVIVDDGHGPARVINSCLVPCIQVDGAKLRTVEGVASPAGLDIVQRTFVEHGGAQCGICTPGFIVMARGFLDTNPGASREEVREALAGNLCRCTGYQKIIDAVVAAVHEEAG